MAKQSKLISTIYQTLEVQDRAFEGDKAVLTVRGPKGAIQAVREQILDKE